MHFGVVSGWGQRARTWRFARTLARHVTARLLPLVEPLLLLPVRVWLVIGGGLSERAKLGVRRRAHWRGVWHGHVLGAAHEVAVGLPEARRRDVSGSVTRRHIRVQGGCDVRCVAVEERNAERLFFPRTAAKTKKNPKPLHQDDFLFFQKGGFVVPSVIRDAQTRAGHRRIAC